MAPLPMKPLPLAVVYFGLAVASWLPGFLAQPAMKTLGGLCICGAMALHGIWMWQAAAVAAELLPPPDPAHRRQRVIALLLIICLGAALVGVAGRLVLGPDFDAAAGGGSPYRLSSLVALIGMPAFAAVIYLVSETICWAERRKDRLATLLQLFYLPLLSPLLYGRLEALQRR